MPEKLKSLLDEQVERAGLLPPALDVITAAGDRRLQRRRLTISAGGLAVVLVLAGGVFAIQHRDSGRSPEPARQGLGPYAEPRPTWAVGSALHYGDLVIDFGRQVDAFVRTGAGFVAVSSGEVWSVDDDGATGVGRVSQGAPQPVTDGEVGLAAWTEGESPDREVVVLDQRSRRVERYAEGEDAEVLGIDSRWVYWRTAAGVVSLELDTGEEDLQVRGDPARAIAASSAEIARTVDHGLRLVEGGTSTLLRGAGTELMSFAPDSRWAVSSTGAGRPVVHDLHTGRVIEVDLDGWEFGLGQGWLDQRHLLVGARRAGGDGTVELLECQIPRGVCAPVASISPTEQATYGYALPWRTPGEAG
ncbi:MULTISPECIES: hypothetical protein [unclassified Nocardioides]|uniref:hypothetical protein n=1 Tax=unclassified Nocardioides TaxID=2615069 RepID=UPI0030156633